MTQQYKEAAWSRSAGREGERKEGGVEKEERVEVLGNVAVSAVK